MTRRRVTRTLLVPLLTTGVLLAAACGSDDEPVVRPPASSTSPTTASDSPTAQSSSPATSASASSPAPGPRHPKTTVQPATGLTDGQAVTVKASGFSPGLSLIVVECADKGQQTGPGDCNLDGSATVQTDESGTATTQLQVTPGPFGANAVVCSKQLPCLVSVTEASFAPTEEADAPISFG